MLHECAILSHFIETMELRGLVQNSCQQTGPLVPETHVNGNKKSISTLSTFNNVGSDNRGSMPSVQNNPRLSRVFYGRLTPLGRSGTSSGLNLTNEPKQQREPSESKLNTLFDQYKVLDKDMHFSLRNKWKKIAHRKLFSYKENGVLCVKN